MNKEKKKINIDLAAQTGGISAFDNITKRALASKRGADLSQPLGDFASNRLRRIAARKGVEVNTLTGYVAPKPPKPKPGGKK